MSKEGCLDRQFQSILKKSHSPHTINVVTSVHLITQKGWPESRASLLRVSYAPNDAPRNETSVHVLTRSSRLPLRSASPKRQGYVHLDVYNTDTLGHREDSGKSTSSKYIVSLLIPEVVQGMKRVSRTRDWNAREIESNVSMPILPVFSKQQPIMLCMH